VLLFQKETIQFRVEPPKSRFGTGGHGNRRQADGTHAEFGLQSLDEFLEQSPVRMAVPGGSGQENSLGMEFTLQNIGHQVSDPLFVVIGKCDAVPVEVEKLARLGATPFGEVEFRVADRHPAPLSPQIGEGTQVAFVFHAVMEIVVASAEGVVHPVQLCHDAVHYCMREVAAGVKPMHVRNVLLDKAGPAGRAVDQKPAHVAMEIHMTDQEVTVAALDPEVIELAVFFRYNKFGNQAISL
jgi:hypothetical protein